MGQYNTVLAEQQLVGWQCLLVLNSGEHYIAGLGGASAYRALGISNKAR